MDFFEESKNFILESDSKVNDKIKKIKYEWINYNIIKGELKSERKENRFLNINEIESKVLKKCNDDIEQYKNQLDVI